MTNPTAHAVASRNRSYRGTRLPLRQLWQVPMFFAGLLGLVSVGTARLVWSHHDNQPDRTLASARRELEQPRPNLERAFALAERGLREASPASSQAAEAHF